MKHIRLLTFVLILGTLVLSACGAAAAQATPAADTVIGGGKVEAMPVAFVGIVDSIAGDQWVISGTTVTVDESVVRDGPFNAGDRVKVEGLVNPDGSLTVSRVEAPTQSSSAADNTNEAISNANTNDANVNDSNINDDSSSGVNSNDDNSNASNSNDSNINDDNGGGNTNDDNSNDSNTNDDNGGNSNDDNSNDDNGGGNSNDDNGNDDNSGGGGGNDDSGGDDNGSGGNGNDD